MNLYEKYNIPYNAPKSFIELRFKESKRLVKNNPEKYNALNVDFGILLNDEGRKAYDKKLGLDTNPDPQEQPFPPGSHFRHCGIDMVCMNIEDDGGITAHYQANGIVEAIYIGGHQLGALVIENNLGVLDE